MSSEIPPNQDDDVLEHALLESLFYNEMAMMDQWSDTVIPTTDDAAPPDPAVSTEKEILDNFGVNHQNPIAHAAIAASPIPNPLALQPEVVNPVTAAAVEQPPSVVSSVVASAPPVTTPTPPFSLPTKSRGIKHNVVVPPAPTQPKQKKTQPPKKPTKTQQQPSPITVSKDRPKLVGQFATLAERLGITIPAEILSRLNANEATASGSTPTAAVNQNTAPAPFPAVPMAPPSVPAKRAPAPAPQVRRRKKPRLHECERRLAELQDENERLKRHLDLVSNRSRQTQVERVQAETKMRQLLTEGAPDSELQPLLHSFQEMYSDYGKKRFEELEFHLEQLQRLAKPADFTKMGLWTLSGQSNNPRHSISSLLLNELSITPPQSRKIMEQREKIRTVCENLKEVRTMDRCYSNRSPDSVPSPSLPRYPAVPRTLGQIAFSV